MQSLHGGGATSLGCIPWLSEFNIYLESLYTTHLAETCRELAPHVVRASWPSQVAFFFSICSQKGLRVASVRPIRTLSRLSYLYPVIYF